MSRDYSHDDLPNFHLPNTVISAHSHIEPTTLIGHLEINFKVIEGCWVWRPETALVSSIFAFQLLHNMRIDEIEDKFDIYMVPVYSPRLFAVFAVPPRYILRLRAGFGYFCAITL